MTDNRDETKLPEEVGLGNEIGSQDESASIQPEATASNEQADPTEQPTEDINRVENAESSDAAEDGNASEADAIEHVAGDGQADTNDPPTNASTEAEAVEHSDSTQQGATTESEPSAPVTDRGVDAPEQTATGSADKDIDWSRIEVEPERLDHLDINDFGSSQIVDKGLTVDCISVPPSDDGSEDVPQSAFSDSSSDGEDEEEDPADNGEEVDAAEDIDAADESLALARMPSFAETENLSSDVIMLGTYDPTPEPAPLLPELYDPHGFLQPLSPGPVDYHQPFYKDRGQFERMQDMNQHCHQICPMARAHGLAGDDEIFHGGQPLHKPGRRRAGHVRQAKDNYRDETKRKPSPLRTSGRLTPSPETSPEGKEKQAAGGFSEAAEHALESSGLKWSEFDEEEDEKADAEWYKEFTQAESRRASDAGLSKGSDISSSPAAASAGSSQPDTNQAFEAAFSGDEASLAAEIADALKEEQVFAPSRLDEAAELARPPTRGKGEDPPQALEESQQVRQEQPQEPEISPLSPEFFTGLELYTGLSAEDGYAYYKEWSSRQPAYNAKPGVYNKLREEQRSPISYVDFNNPGSRNPIENGPQLSGEAQTRKQQFQIRDKHEAERALLSRRVKLMQSLTERLNHLRSQDPRRLSEQEWEEREKIGGTLEKMKDKDVIMLEIFKLQMLRYRYSRFVYREQRDEYHHQRDRYREERERYRGERNEARDTYTSLKKLMEESGLEGVPAKVQHLEQVIEDLDAYNQGTEAQLEEERSKTKQAKQEFRLMKQRYEEATEDLEALEPLIHELEMEKKFHEKTTKRMKVAEWKLQKVEEAQDEIVKGVYEKRDQAVAALKAEGEKALQDFKIEALDAAAKLVQEITALQAELGKCRQQGLDLESENERLTKELAAAGTEAKHNADVEQLQNEIEGLHETAEGLESELAAQREANAELTRHQQKSAKADEDLQADLDATSEQLTVADKRIEELEAELEQLKAGKEIPKGLPQKAVEWESSLAASPARSPKRLPVKTVAPVRPVPIQTDSDEMVPQALPTSDITRTPHHVPLRTPMLPGRPQAWVEHEARLMQSQAYLANVQRRREVREAREQMEKANLEEVRKALAASCGWEEMPYVPRAQRWTHLVA